MDKEEVLRNAHELIEYSEGMKIDEVRESPHRAAPSTVGRDFFKNSALLDSFSMDMKFRMW
ncbi:MAG: hypothetical protein LUQ36_08600 [Methanoregula sp.]|jgi:hypothetical protein|nr:hypothetical protein [Methanoregula sp.]